MHFQSSIRMSNNKLFDSFRTAKISPLSSDHMSCANGPVAQNLLNSMPRSHQTLLFATSLAIPISYPLTYWNTTHSSDTDNILHNHPHGFALKAVLVTSQYYTIARTDMGTKCNGFIPFHLLSFSCECAIEWDYMEAGRMFVCSSNSNSVHSTPHSTLHILTTRVQTNKYSSTCSHTNHPQLISVYVFGWDWELSTTFTRLPSVPSTRWNLIRWNPPHIS